MRLISKNLHLFMKIILPDIRHCTSTFQAFELIPYCIEYSK
jgi:hypothetical protein